MSARAVDEPHRTASQLELLFDLTFVVAVATVTAQFAHDVAEGQALSGLVPFLQVFFAIWWAWMNFTWFASSYDTDDVAYRLLTMVQMAGVLVLAAGVPAAADHSDYAIITLGYLVMRIGLVAQWLRAGLEDPAGRRTAFRYAGGVAVLQAGWLARLALANSGALPASSVLSLFVLLACLELMVPWWAERSRATSWHPHHIAERYGLFTIILLGESVFAVSRGVAGALAAGRTGGPFLVVAGSGLVLLFSLWWLYFLRPAGVGLRDRRHRSYLWGYGHYGIFACLAALGAGLEVAAESSGHDVAASPLALGYVIAVPVAGYLSLVWAAHVIVVAGPGVLRGTDWLGCVVVVLLLPLAAPRIGVAAVVAAISAACVCLVAVMICAPAPGMHERPDMGNPEVLDLHDHTRTAWRGGGPRPVRTLLWRPAPDGREARPLVVVSHGSGGAPTDLAWLAESLSSQGFLVAAVEHHGNNNQDNLPEGRSFWWERPRDLSFVVDHLQRTESLAGVGVVGYSLGGYAAAAVLGARIDAGKLNRLYAGESVLPIPAERPEIAAEVARVLAKHGREAVVRRAVADYRDRRFRAGVLLAPAICPILDDESLAAVGQPVLVRWGDADDVEAPDDNGRRYTRLIPGADGRSMGEYVGHFAFGNRDGDGDGDDASVRAIVAAEALAFFGSHLEWEARPNRGRLPTARPVTRRER